MDDRERRLLHALATMARQYLTDSHTHKGALDNLCMSTGEEAMELLAEYGLITFDEGQLRIGRWTQAGCEFLDLY